MPGPRRYRSPVGVLINTRAPLQDWLGHLASGLGRSRAGAYFARVSPAEFPAAAVAFALDKASEWDLEGGGLAPPR